MLFSFFCLAILFLLNLGLKIISGVFPLCLSLKMRPLRQRTHGGFFMCHINHGTMARVLLLPTSKTPWEPGQD